MLLLFKTLLLYCSLLFIQKQASKEMQEITVEKMKVQWVIKDQNVQFHLSAPTKGWLAIGLNTENRLKGTNLIMGAVKKGKVQISDRYILKAGTHKAIIDLGQKAQIQSHGGQEGEGHTQLHFEIPLLGKTSYHHLLKEGKRYYLLVAYAVSDDFDHHSIMRKTIPITL